MKSTEERSPSKRPRASMRIDLPDPVSPLKTLRPCLNSTCNRSITAKFTIFKSRSISYWLFQKLVYAANRKDYTSSHIKCDKTILQTIQPERAEMEERE